MKRSISDIFSVRVDTKALCEYLGENYDEETNKYAQQMYLEIADSFERMSKPVLEKQAQIILDEALLDWDI